MTEKVEDNDDAIDRLIRHLEAATSERGEGGLHIFSKDEVAILLRVIAVFRFLQNLGVFGKWMLGLFIGLGSTYLLFRDVLERWGSGNGG